MSRFSTSSKRHPSHLRSVADQPHDAVEVGVDRRAGDGSQESVGDDERLGHVAADDDGDLGCRHRWGRVQVDAEPGKSDDGTLPWWQPVRRTAHPRAFFRRKVSCCCSASVKRLTAVRPKANASSNRLLTA